MAALLDQETASYRELRRGEIIEGTVVGTDRDGVLVDIGAKSEGVIPPGEMHSHPQGASSLNIGDKVLVAVVQPESHEGQIILSMDRARGEHGWRVLQEYLDANEAFEGHVTGSNKGGLLVNVEGVNAFVPLSQIVAGPDRSDADATQRALQEWVGKGITLKVIELNRRRNRAILSERSAVQEKRAAEKDRLLLELEEGDVRTGRITSIRDFGIFVDIGGADGLVHLSELSWERTPRTPNDLFKVGDEVPVYVLKIDQEAKKIALSVRRAQPERWEEMVSRYREGMIVPGQVTKLAPFGAFVRMEGPIEGLIHISELVDRRITHPKEVAEEGDVVPVKIVRIEYERHRLGLSLKQARDAAEEDGWAFNASGGATNAPADALERLGLTEMPQRAPRVETEDEAPAETAAVAEPEVTDAAVEGAEAVATEEAPEAEAVAEGEDTVEMAESVEESATADAVAEVASEDVVTEPETEVTAQVEEPAEAVAEVEADEPADEEAAPEEAVAEAIETEESPAEEAVEEAAADEPVAEAAPEDVEAEAFEVNEDAEEAVAEAEADEPAAEEPVEEAAPEEAGVEASGAEEPPSEEAVAEVEAEEPAEAVAETEADEPAAEEPVEEAASEEADVEASEAEEPPSEEAVAEVEAEEPAAEEAAPEEAVAEADETTEEAAGDVSEDEVTSLEEGIEAAAEGAAPDVTEDVSPALNSSGTGEN